ncbi:hypothetical protein [Schinkia azotoformans]|uniref:hypothetical protein n=1 Tax=Schinkia azotoformans TaxID=1454 RepID=UPI002DBCBB32|nr:hypothetical protein [Schinkia azotoformans]MEC1778403.1 hypothetical protein [Schinkia azotoformans]MED4328352.1 hypothetical protein [Schinkia azotoformans]
MTLNDKSKERLRKMNNLLVSKLEETFNVNVYQDYVSEDEEKGYHYFIFETGGFTSTSKDYTLTQDVLVRYYSENLDDLDERALDVISVIKDIGYTFENTNKTAIQKGDTDAYIDEIEFYFKRVVKYGS